MDIWKEAIELGNKLYDLAERAERLRKYRFAEQLNGASMSISNNIAEGSGSNSDKEFARYLKIGRESCRERV